MANDPTKVNLKDVIKQEYIRCASNPQYFIRKYCYIQHPIRGRILFDLFKYQNEAIDDFQKFNYNIILKGRQIGITTAAAAYALWLMLFHSDKSVLVIATQQDTAKVLISKVKFAFDQLPVWMRIGCTENNKLSLKFDNGSTIQASSASDNAARGSSISLLIVDEAAFIRNIENIWVAAQPTLSSGGRAIIISSPNGQGNFFHATWEKAVSGEEIELVGEQNLKFKFNPIKLDWRVHPERDDAWRKNMGAITGELKARQEFDAEFIGSGNTVIDADLIEFFAESISEPIMKSGPGGGLWVWHEPIAGHDYVVCADVARGDGSDYSAFHVIHLKSLNQVAEFKGKIGTTEYADLLMSVGVNYQNALLVVENAAAGWAVIQRLIDRSYPNLFYMHNDIQVVDPLRRITNRYRPVERKMTPGFTTSVNTRPVMISKLTEYMLDVKNSPEYCIKINSMRTIQELRVFIWDKGKAQAMDGYNDDLVMSLCIGLWVRDTALVVHDRINSMTRTAMDGITRVGHDAVYTQNPLGVDPYTMPISNGLHGEDKTLDIRWLLS